MFSLIQLIPNMFLVYVDATDACNTAAFQLGTAAIGTSIPARSWNLKVKFSKQCRNSLPYNRLVCEAFVIAKLNDLRS